MQLPEWLRLANAVLGMVALVWLVMRVNHRWAELEATDRAGRAVMMLLVFTGTYGSGEAYAMSSPIGFRTGLVTISFGAVLLHLTVLTARDLQSRRRMKEPTS